MDKEARSLLAGFVLERVLSEDAKIRYASLLGHYKTDNGGIEAAIVLLEKTHFSSSFYQQLGANSTHDSSLSRFRSLGSNDVYSWALGWMPSTDVAGSEARDAHVKLTVIRPATEAHLAKYAEQFKVMITETPELYRNVIKPWIETQPISRIQWVYNILEKKKEAETILYEQEGKNGFIVSSRNRQRCGRKAFKTVTLRPSRSYQT